MEDKHSTKKQSYIFKRHNSLDFLYHSLSDLIEKRFLLYGMNKEALETYFEDSLNSLFSAKMFSKIRSCLLEHVNAKAFIRTTLKSEFKAYISQYNESQVELHFQRQIKSANHNLATDEIIKELELMAKKSLALIDEWKPSSKVNKEPVRKEIKQKWQQLISKANRNRSLVESISFSSKSQIAWALLYFSGCIYLTNKSMQNIYYPLVGYMLPSIKEEVDKNSDSWVEEDTFQASTMLTFFSIVASIFVANRIYNGIAKKPTIQFENILSAVIATYNDTHPPTASEKSSYPHVFEIIPKKNLTPTLKTVTFHEEKTSSPTRKVKRKHFSKDLTESTGLVERNKSSRLEVYENAHGKYIQLNNADGIETHTFFRRPPSPISDIQRKIFEQVSKKPVIHPSGSTGKAGLKFFGNGEHKKFPGCSHKLKLMDKENNSLRYGVESRAPTDEEQSTLKQCETILEVNFKKSARK